MDIVRWWLQNDKVRYYKGCNLFLKHPGRGESLSIRASKANFAETVIERIEADNKEFSLKEFVIKGVDKKEVDRDKNHKDTNLVKKANVKTM